MNKSQKEELRKVIVKELKEYNIDKMIMGNLPKDIENRNQSINMIKYRADEWLKKIADNILSEIPDDESVVTEADIVELLYKLAKDSLFYGYISEDSINLITQAILQGPKWEVVDRIKIYEGNSVSLELDISKYKKPVTIEIAVREIK